MLDQDGYLSKTMSDVAENDMLLFSNYGKTPTYGFDAGWNGFEFILPYTNDYRGCKLNISV